jgi:hypothetical protein
VDEHESEDRQPGKPLILILVKRASILLLVVCAVSLFYWTVGSVSSFLDSTQAMLLSIMRLSSLGILVSSGLGLLLSLALAIGGRHGLRVLGLVGYLAAVGFGAVALALAQSVSILSLGLP